VAQEVSGVAQPQAAATSNNTNQSVQINQNGTQSRQSFGGGLSCNGPTFNVTPFYMGNDSLASSYTRGNNWGIQFGVTAPLDGSITEMCKEAIRRKLEKERLDYEIVRALKCAQLLDLGYTIRPDSALHVLCGHVVATEAWLQIQPQADSVRLQSSSVQSSLPASSPSPAAETSEQPPSSPQQTPEQQLQQLLQPW